jgi:hypothetical protein
MHSNLPACLCAYGLFGCRLHHTSSEISERGTVPVSMLMAETTLRILYFHNLYSLFARGERTVRGLCPSVSLSPKLDGFQLHLKPGLKFLGVCNFGTLLPLLMFKSKFMKFLKSGPWPRKMG